MFIFLAAFQATSKNSHNIPFKTTASKISFSLNGFLNYIQSIQNMLRLYLWFNNIVISQNKDNKENFEKPS